MTSLFAERANLISDYILDLRVDIRCAHRDGLTKYAAKRQKELDQLEAARKSGRPIEISKWGIPHIVHGFNR